MAGPSWMETWRRAEREIAAIAALLRRGRRFAVAAGVALCGGCEGDTEVGVDLGPITELPSPAGDGSGEPNLAVAADGSVYLSWQEPAFGAHELRFATLAGDGWSQPATIARGADWFVNWADFPAIVSLPGGRLAAHYLQRNPLAGRGYGYDVRVVQSSDGGGTWSAPITPHRDATPTEHGFVSLFPMPGDSLGLIWLDGRKFAAEFGGSEEMALLYATIAADGSVGAEVVVDERICECCQTSAALTAAGVVVAYRDRSGGEIRDIHVARMTEGRWAPGRPVHRDGWEIAACPVNGPSIASDGEQRVAVAWFTGARDTAQVQVAFSDDAGATFDRAIRVDEGDPAGRVGVVMLPDGSALVSWIERLDGSAASVRARRVRDDGRMSAPMVVAASMATRASGFHRMAASAGAVVFAWTEPGSPSRVRTARAELGEGEVAW